MKYYWWWLTSDSSTDGIPNVIVVEANDEQDKN